MSVTNELKMLQRQTEMLGVYVSELQHLEQPGMPVEYQDRARRIRQQTAPKFFRLVANLLYDALIQGLANILDRPKTMGNLNLTLESEIENQSRGDLKRRLQAIKKSPTYTDIRAARTKLLSHSDHAAVTSYDTMTVAKDFPNLTLGNLGELVNEIREIVIALGGDRRHPSWEGVERLFKLLDGPRS
jgi:hypothetical protein